MRDRLFVMQPGFEDKGSTYFCHAFVEKTIEILHYLAATRSVPLPH